MTKTYKEKLQELRDEILAVDDALLNLVKQRLDIATRIGRTKKAEGLPVKNQFVEAQVVDRCRSRARGLGIDQDLAEEIAKIQIQYSCKKQEELMKAVEIELVNAETVNFE